jgi:hypothetical protein
MSHPTQKRVLGPAVWMMILSLLLCWLPLLRPLRSLSKCSSRPQPEPK